MKILQETETEAIAKLLKSGQLVVARTDTIYGILGLADNQVAVEYLYQLRQRPKDKASIVLISDPKQLWDQKSCLAFQKAPEFSTPTSVIVPAGDKTPAWITRGGDTIAVRRPELSWLLSVLDQAGSCIAPSANLASQPPARTIKEAVKIFGDSVVYVEGGEVSANVKPSNIVEITKNHEIIRIR